MTSATPNYQSPEIITVPHDTIDVCCDGGNAVLGHPKTYYRFAAEQNRITCGYCDREFVKQAS